MSGTTLFLLSVILITIAYFFFRTGQNARQQAGDREEQETAEGIAPPDGEKQIAVSPVPHGVHESPEKIHAARVVGSSRRSQRFATGQTGRLSAHSADEQN